MNWSNNSPWTSSWKSYPSTSVASQSLSLFARARSASVSSGFRDVMFSGRLVTNKERKVGVFDEEMMMVGRPGVDTWNVGLLRYRWSTTANCCVYLPPPPDEITYSLTFT